MDLSHDLPDTKNRGPAEEVRGKDCSVCIAAAFDYCADVRINLDDCSLGQFRSNQHFDCIWDHNTSTLAISLEPKDCHANLQQRC